MSGEANISLWCDVFNGEMTKEKRMLESHSHNHYELSCVLKGRVNVIFDNKKFSFINNCFILSPPNTSHNIIVSEGTFYRYNFYFYKSALDKLLGYSVKCDKLFREGGIAFKMQDSTAERINKIGEMFLNETREETKKLLLGIVLTEIIANMDPTATDANRTSYIDDVERIILQAYGSKLLATDLANRFYISRTKLMTDFKKKTGKTLNEYITFVRLEMAKEMLVLGKSIYETAVACRFVNAANFTRIFKKQFNMCPRDYRKNFSA